MIEPCAWPVSYAECGPCDALEAAGESIGFWENMAATFLWNWTGRAYGLCPVIVRPCRKDCYEGRSTYWGSGPVPPLVGGTFTPVLLGGQWFNIGCGICGDDCSCRGDGTTALRLPGPIDAITEVWIDGALMPPGSFRVDNASLLVRTDGGGWPKCQDMTAAETDVGAFAIEYNLGHPVPAGGQVAAGVLACELAKAACNDNTCRLPNRIQQVTRQGVTVLVTNELADIEKGGTGIWLIDSWVASVMKPPRAGTVRSVDVPHPRNRRTTWPVV